MAALRPMTSNNAHRQLVAKRLRRQIRTHFNRMHRLDAPETKEYLRSLHQPAVRAQLSKNRLWIKANYPRFREYFANGEDVVPRRIRPALIEVHDDYWGCLFRLARLTWSLPFTKGYGRRLRFLLLDESNGKLIGILGLQSPPLDFPARDKLFTYPKARKSEFVNQTMDVYTLGALAPYNVLLGGKLVAVAAASDEVRHAYKEKYAGRATEMLGNVLPARLVGLTTTSAYGRSSIYNRLKYHDHPIAESIGYTQGFGSFHLAPLYPEICKYLEDSGELTRGGYGVGPRIMWQNFVRAFHLLELPGDLLMHGVKREAFLFPLCSNLVAYMSAANSRPSFYKQSFSELSEWWRDRWLLPRADRVDGWHAWNKDEMKLMLGVGRR